MSRTPATLSALALLMACATPSSTPWLPPGRIVDLSHAFDAATIYWPTEEGFVHERGFAGETEQGYYYEAHRFRAAEHGGTHIDAPIHFARGKRSVDAIPLDQLLGPGLVIDVSEQCARDPDYRIAVSDLEAFEAEHGPIEAGSILLLRTGFSARWPDRTTYLGTAKRGPAAVADLHFPGLDPQAARWLMEKRRPRAIGIDTASIDPGQSTLFESHRVLFEEDVPAFENLAHLDALPTRGATIIALPMKIAGGSGAPLRIIAILPSNR